MCLCLIAGAEDLIPDLDDGDGAVVDIPASLSLPGRLPLSYVCVWVWCSLNQKQPCGMGSGRAAVHRVRCA